MTGDFERKCSRSPRILVLASFFMGLCLVTSIASGQVVVTPASGGTNIPADKAANATSPAWTTLGDIVNKMMLRHHMYQFPRSSVDASS